MSGSVCACSMPLVYCKRYCLHIPEHCAVKCILEVLTHKNRGKLLYKTQTLGKLGDVGGYQLESYEE